MLIVLKWLKLQTSDFMCMFSGTIQTWSLKNFSKIGGVRVMWPPKFLVSWADHTHLVQRTDTKWAWSARVTKFVIFHPLNYFWNSWQLTNFKRRYLWNGSSNRLRVWFKGNFWEQRIQWICFRLDQIQEMAACHLGKFRMTISLEWVICSTFMNYRAALKEYRRK